MSLPSRPSCLPRPLVPQTDPFTARFWLSLEQGRFEAPRCGHCGRWQFPPRPLCPACHAESMEWAELRGRGTLYARTRIHAAGGPFACMTPYSVGVVDLDEGVRLLTRLLHDASNLQSGSGVQLVVVRHTDGPLFAAAAAVDPT